MSTNPYNSTEVWLVMFKNSIIVSRQKVLKQRLNWAVSNKVFLSYAWKLKT